MGTKWLVATTGLPYSGKSTFARTLAEPTGSRVIELDVLNSMRGLDVAHGVSIQDWENTFAEASALAASELSRGRSVVIDWVNAGVGDRRRWRELADACGAAFLLVSFAVEDEELDRRASSLDEGRVALDRALVERVRGRYRPPGEDECAITYESGSPVSSWVAQYMPDVLNR